MEDDLGLYELLKAFGFSGKVPAARGLLVTAPDFFVYFLPKLHVRIFKFYSLGQNIQWQPSAVGVVFTKLQYAIGRESQGTQPC